MWERIDTSGWETAAPSLSHIPLLTRIAVLRRLLIIAVACGLWAAALSLFAGGAAGAREAACASKACLYDVRVVIAYTIQGRATVSVVARFPRVALRKTYSKTGMDSGNPPRVLGTVTGDVDFQGEQCTHHRTYSAPARLDVRANIGRRGNLVIDFASPKVIPPNWAEACPSLREQNLSLGDAIAGGTFLVGAVRRWNAAIGSSAQTTLGADSLAGSYYLIFKRPQREGSLAPPLRQLWAGKSAVVREQKVQAGLGTFNVRVTLTRR